MTSNFDIIHGPAGKHDLKRLSSDVASDHRESVLNLLTGDGTDSWMHVPATKDFFATPGCVHHAAEMFYLYVCCDENGPTYAGHEKNIWAYNGASGAVPRSVLVRVYNFILTWFDEPATAGWVHFQKTAENGRRDAVELHICDPTDGEDAQVGQPVVSTASIFFSLDGVFLRYSEHTKITAAGWQITEKHFDVTDDYLCNEQIERVFGLIFKSARSENSLFMNQKTGHLLGSAFVGKPSNIPPSPHLISDEDYQADWYIGHFLSCVCLTVSHLPILAWEKFDRRVVGLAAMLFKLMIDCISDDGNKKHPVSIKYRQAIVKEGYAALPYVKPLRAVSRSAVMDAYFFIKNMMLPHWQFVLDELTLVADLDSGCISLSYATEGVKQFLMYFFGNGMVDVFSRDIRSGRQYSSQPLLQQLYDVQSMRSRDLISNKTMDEQLEEICLKRNELGSDNVSIESPEVIEVVTRFMDAMQVQLAINKGKADGSQSGVFGAEEDQRTGRFI